LDSRWKILLFVIGATVDFLFAVGIAILHRRIEKLLVTLGREEL